MTWRRHHRRHRPPWWPETEPWPPENARAGWRRGRARFVRRIALVFALMLFLSALGISTLVSMLFGGRAVAGATAPMALAIMIVLVVAGALAVSMRRVGGPLGDVVEAANRLASGDYAARVPEHGPPSLRTVGHAFNSMAARLESQDRLRRQLMADIAHELRTPLTVIQGRIEALLDGVYPRDDAQLGQTLAETRMLARLVEDLRTLAHAESGTLTLQKEPTDVAVLAQEVVDTFAAEATARKVTMELRTPGPNRLRQGSGGLAEAQSAEAEGPGLLLEAPPEGPGLLREIDPLRVREILINLISNALQHTPSNGRISIDLSAATDRITMRVADTGTGIAADELPRIFDRFYKGSTSRGSGLGLAIARNLVTAHGGTITAESVPGRGTTITFSLKTSDEGEKVN